MDEYFKASLGTHSQDHLIRDAGMKSTAFVCKILADVGIPSALVGVGAAAHYGGGLCPLDIELVINGLDQERAFTALSLQNISPSMTDDMAAEKPTDFSHWRDLVQSYRFRDRRRLRPNAHIYQVPRTGEPFEDISLPFVILNSADYVGLPAVPSYVPNETMVNGPASSVSPYTLTSVLDGLQLGNDEQGEVMDCLLPKLSLLVESEMHVLLRHAQVLSPVWGQHAAQLSELLRSRSCPNGPDAFLSTVDPKFSEFARWIALDLKGEANYADLDGIRERYVNNKLACVGSEQNFAVEKLQQDSILGITEE